ncbi:hypothetical protein CL647_02515 [bacterium]|nr:hypothetical protein [bacterium]|tara:strand:+ start:116 stop:742 length:627 start_codon:yes stop_codon:yes gene_type:complete
MNLTGKQKSQLLISLIEEKSTDVLKHLSEESATILTSTLDDVPTINDEEMGEFLTLVLEGVSEKEFEISDSGEDDLFSEEEEEKEEEMEDREEEPEEEEVIPEEKLFPENYRSLETIASHLSSQENQMIAFFFKYVEEELGNAIQEHMTDEKIAAYQTCKVEATPMAERIFKRLFDLIILKTAEEIEEEKKQAETNQEQETEVENFDF